VGLAAAAVLVVLSLTRGLDDTADGYYEQALTRALVTFGIARALNGVISVVQGTEVAVHPAGLGVNFAPGQLVDPLNDLVERFSWVMLVASVSLGMQKILMDISAWWGIQVLVALAGAAWMTLMIIRRGPMFRAVALRVFLLVLFLRLAMPLMVILNHAVYDVFMAPSYENSSQVISDTSEQLEAMQLETQAGADQSSESGWLDSLGAWLDDTSDSMDVKGRLEAFQERLNQATEHLLRLAAVFMLQTVVFPLLFLWAFARGLGPIVRSVGKSLRSPSGTV
jgi:hypothetical protein